MEARNHVRLGLLFVFAVAMNSSGVRAESKEGDKAGEATKVVADDDDDRVSEVAITGKITLNPLGKNGEIPQIAGKIVEKGITYLLKLTDPKIQRERLVKVGEKEIQLRGILSEDKKYLTVSDVGITTAVPPAPTEGL